MNLEQRLRRLESELPEKRPAGGGLTLAQLQDPELRELAAGMAGVMARRGGYDPTELERMKAKLDARLAALGAPPTVGRYDLAFIDPEATRLLTDTLSRLSGTDVEADDERDAGGEAQ